MTSGKGLIRSKNRRGTLSGKLTRAEASTQRSAEPAVCEGCGAVWSRRTWRRGRPMTHVFLQSATWRTCPACRQATRQEYVGRVLVRGAYVAANEDTIRRRIANVATRAGKQQTQRRLVSVERADSGLEILTTSQKLAHRIAHELKKAFRGRVQYAWSDDGSLFATWQRESL